MVKELVLKTGTRWSDDSVPRLSAAFSFYAILSLAPMLVLAVTVAGLFIKGAEKHLMSEASGFVGPQGAAFLRELIDKTHNTNASIIATISSLAVTFFSASNLFLQLDDAMKTIWRLRTSGPFFHTLIKTRILAFLGVLVFGAIVVGWLILDSWLRRLGRDPEMLHIWPTLNFLFSIGVLTIAFGISFKSLPKHGLEWRDVWPAAWVTAIGFGISKFLLSEYFVLAGLSAAYGAAGALVVILLWLYYSAQIYFFGAELAYIWAHEYGSAYHAEDLAAKESGPHATSFNSEA